MSGKAKKIFPLYFYNAALCTPKIDQAAAWLKKGQKLFMRYLDVRDDKNQKNDTPQIEGTPHTSDYVTSIFKSQFTTDQFIQTKDSSETMYVCRLKVRPRVVTVDVKFVADDGTKFEGIRRFAKAVPEKERRKFKMVYWEGETKMTTSYIKSISLREDSNEYEDFVLTDTDVSYFIVD